jgi:O-succinylbenzoic acid--CoA ligase
MTKLVCDPLVMRSERVPDEPALKAGAVEWTRWQLRDAADSLAAALHEAGIRPGHRVASLLADAAPAVVLINAARRLGATLVPLNRRAADPELEAQLRLAAVTALLYDSAHADRAVALDTGSAPGHRIEALLAGSACAPGSVLRDELDLDGAAVIIFTSGTTGQPKGAVLSHRALAASAHDWSDRLGRSASDRWLACLPLYHVAGLAIVVRSGRWGVPLELHPGFDPEAVSAALDAGISHLSLVAVQLERLLAVRGDRPAPATLRAILLGGGPVPAALLERARAAGYPVVTTYGLTETSSGVATGGLDAATLADPTALRPLPRAELRVEPDGAPDGGGPILVRGPMVFDGYVDDPAATAAAFDDGWLRTGDVGRLDPHGLLHVLDRRDDLIVSGGENVYPAEIESVLREHPAVTDAAVTGRPDPRWGAVPFALVVPRAGAAIEPDALREHCRARLAAYKVPVDYVAVPALPRDELGKLRRRELSAAAGRGDA